MNAEQKRVVMVVPFLNEQENIPVLYDRVCKAMDGQPEQWELLFINDGSTDGSLEWIRNKAKEDSRVRMIILSRNFGHQYAITAGMDNADGDAVVIMDADLQDPPEIIPELLQKWREGYEVVYAVRRSRAGETWLKKFLASSFYRIFRFLAKVNVPMDAGDFRLVDRCVVDALKDVRELHRFMRGLTCWVGYRQAAVKYDRAARYSGETKYPIWKSARLAFDAITSFSASPLRWIIGLGLMVCMVALLWVVFMIMQAIVHPEGMEKGWASIIAVMVFLGGVQLVSIGVLGQYVSRVFEEGKHRPLYLIREKIGR